MVYPLSLLFIKSCFGCQGVAPPINSCLIWIFLVCGLYDFIFSSFQVLKIIEKISENSLEKDDKNNVFPLGEFFEHSPRKKVFSWPKNHLKIACILYKNCHGVFLLHRL